MRRMKESNHGEDSKNGLGVCAEMKEKVLILGLGGHAKVLLDVLLSLSVEILGFTDKSLQNPAPNQWAVRKDGGEFDQFTGATITPRAVVGAVKRTLEWSQQHFASLFPVNKTSTGAQP